MFRKLLTIMVACIGLMASGLMAEAGERYSKQKVAYHINYPGGKDDKAYLGALRNIQNHINAVGAENMEIKVVPARASMALAKASATRWSRKWGMRLI